MLICCHTDEPLCNPPNEARGTSEEKPTSGIWKHANDLLSDSIHIVFLSFNQLQKTELNKRHIWETNPHSRNHPLQVTIIEIYIKNIIPSKFALLLGGQPKNGDKSDPSGDNPSASTRSGRPISVVRFLAWPHIKLPQLMHHLYQIFFDSKFPCMSVHTTKCLGLSFSMTRLAVKLTTSRKHVIMIQRKLLQQSLRNGSLGKEGHVHGRYW